MVKLLQFMISVVWASASSTPDQTGLLQHNEVLSKGIEELGTNVAGTDETFERQDDQKVLKEDFSLDIVSNDTVMAAIEEGGCKPPDEFQVAKFIMFEIEAFMGAPDFCWRKVRGQKCHLRDTKGQATRGGKKFYACKEHHPCPEHWGDVWSTASCRQRCVGDQPVSCGVAACARTKGDCTRAIISITVGVLSAIKSSLLLVFPGGVLVNKVQMSAQRASQLKQGAKAGFPSALSKMKHILTSESARDAIIQKAKQKMKKYIKDDLELDCEVAKQMMQQTIAAVGKSMQSKEPDDMDKFDFALFDSDGMAQAIKEEKVNTAATWLRTAGAVDPSGWLSAAATFVKPTCDDYGSWEEYDRLPETKVSPPRRRARPCKNGCSFRMRGKCLSKC